MAERSDVEGVFARRVDEAEQALHALALAIDVNLPRARAALARLRSAFDGAESACTMFAMRSKPLEHEVARERVQAIRIAFARLFERWIPIFADGFEMTRVADAIEPSLFAAAAEVVRADLSGSILAGSVLRELRANEARFDRIDAARAKWKACRFVECSLVAALFDGSGMDSCDFSRANLTGSRWRGANAVQCRFAGAMLFDADCHQSIFAECNFRGADFGTRNPSLDSTGAFFYRCDLRESGWGERDLSGVRFVECKMFGVHGRPKVADVIVTAPDTSPDGDGSRSQAQDVYSAWCS